MCGWRRKLERKVRSFSPALPSVFLPCLMPTPSCTVGNKSGWLYVQRPIREPRTTAMIWCYLRGICWFRLLQVGPWGNGDVFEFRLQLSSSCGSALLSRRYGMHRPGIRTRDLLIIPAYDRVFPVFPPAAMALTRSSSSEKDERVPPGASAVPRIVSCSPSK